MKFVKSQILKFDVFNVIIIGKISAISTSKMRKIIAIKKNRMEKGIREELKGLNPHSKGDIFSRIVLDFIERKEEIIITIKEIKKNKKEINNKLKIIYIKKF
jgi:hypothetical protein